MITLHTYSNHSVSTRLWHRYKYVRRDNIGIDLQSQFVVNCRNDCQNHVCKVQDELLFMTTFINVHWRALDQSIKQDKLENITIRTEQCVRANHLHLAVPHYLSIKHTHFSHLLYNAKEVAHIITTYLLPESLRSKNFFPVTLHSVLQFVTHHQISSISAFNKCSLTVHLVPNNFLKANVKLQLNSGTRDEHVACAQTWSKETEVVVVII